MTGVISIEYAIGALSESIPEYQRTMTIREHTESRLPGKTETKMPSIGIGTWGFDGYGIRDTRMHKEAIEALKCGIELETCL